MCRFGELKWLYKYFYDSITSFLNPGEVVIRQSHHSIDGPRIVYYIGRPTIIGIAISFNSTQCLLHIR